jgi:anion-transporting  ArsA/GET3 family ATPase
MKSKSPQLIFSFGPGGAGKTTLAAGLALSYAKRGKKVCCITIDPSKRLASALGLKVPYPISPKPVVLEKHSFDVMVIQGEPLFDELIKELLPQKHSEIIQTNVYRVMASGLQGLEHYMAINVLHKIHQEKKYDVVIVDTPPTRHAVNFLQAPDRMGAILNQQFFRFFVHGYGAVGKGSFFLVKDVYQFASRILEKFFGVTFLYELANFFSYFEDVLDELRSRINATRDWINDPQTACLLIGYEYMQKSEVQYYLRHVMKHKITKRSFIYNQSLAGVPVSKVTSKSPDWEVGLYKRVQLHKKAVEQYKKWAKTEKLQFLEVPLFLDASSTQDIMKAVAEFFKKGIVAVNAAN